MILNHPDVAARYRPGAGRAESLKRSFRHAEKVCRLRGIEKRAAPTGTLGALDRIVHHRPLSLDIVG